MEPLRLNSQMAPKKKRPTNVSAGEDMAVVASTPATAAAERAPVLQRLRTAGLRPTIARIGIYQVIAAARPYGVSADEVFQRMLRRGTRASASTVYRVIREFDSHGLVSSVWDESKKAVYLIKASESDPRVVLIGCSRTGRLVAIDDADLHARLLAAALQFGLDLAGRDLLVRA